MNLFDLNGRTALVTGGGRGIGAMIAHGLVESGANVVIASRDQSACKQTAEELRSKALDGQSVEARVADLSTEDGCRTLVDSINADPRHLDILVNNSGSTWGAPLADFPATAWDKVLKLNVQAPFLLVQGLLPKLRAATTATGSPARIINIGSVDGIRNPGMPNYSYAASKAALHHLTRILAVELADSAVTVNAIAPGPFESKMMAAVLEQHGEEIAASVPLGRIGRPTDIAGAAIYLASAAGSYVTGTVIPVDGGLSAR